MQNRRRRGEKNDEREVCTRRGTLPEVKRENDRRNTPKRVSTSRSGHSLHVSYCVCVRLATSWEMIVVGGNLVECSPLTESCALVFLFA